jgi:hypothetical protein
MEPNEDRLGFELVKGDEPEESTALQKTRMSLSGLLGAVQVGAFPAPLPWEHAGCGKIVAKDGAVVAQTGMNRVAVLIVEAVNAIPAMLEELERQEREARGLSSCEICGAAGSIGDPGSHYDTGDGGWFCASCVAEQARTGEDPEGTDPAHAPTLPCDAPSSHTIRRCSTIASAAGRTRGAGSVGEPGM